MCCAVKISIKSPHGEKSPHCIKKSPLWPFVRLKLQCCANRGKFYHIPKYSRPWLKLRLFIYVPYPSEGLKLHTTITTTYCATMLQYFTKKTQKTDHVQFCYYYYLLQLCWWKLIIIANFWRQSCQVIIIELVM